jgi:hypothetical protein
MAAIRCCAVYDVRPLARSSGSPMVRSPGRLVTAERVLQQPADSAYSSTERTTTQEMSYVFFAINAG